MAGTGVPEAQWRERLRDAENRGADAAAAIATEWLDDFPRAPAPHLYLGQHFLRRQDWERAGMHLERFLEVRGQNAVAWMDLGMARAQCNDDAGAIEAFCAAVRCAPQREKARSRLYFALRRSGRLKEAHDVGVAWLRDFPDSEQARESVGGDAPARPALLGIMNSLRHRDVATAEQQLSTLVGSEGMAQLFPARAWLKLTLAFRMRRRIATAMKCCDIGLAGDPSHRKLRALRGNFALRTGDFGTAGRYVQDLLISGSADDPDLWTDLALALLQQDGCGARGRRALTEAVGRREEGVVHRDLFGNASSMVPFFGASIEQAFS